MKYKGANGMKNKEIRIFPEKFHACMNEPAANSLQEDDDCNMLLEEETEKPCTNGEASNPLQEDDDLNMLLEWGAEKQYSTPAAKKQKRLSLNRTTEDVQKDASLELQLQNVTVPTYTAGPNGARNYRKTDYCMFCKGTFTSKISVHLLSVHAAEPEVARVAALPKYSTERENGLEHLQIQGNFKHNCEVIKDGNGELVVARRISANSKTIYRAHDFLPCEFCQGFYLKHCLWQHAAKCKFKPTCDEPSANYVRNGRYMLYPFINKNLDEEQRKLKEFFSGMKETAANPGVPNICQNDDLIVNFASAQLERLGTKEEQRRKDMDNHRSKVRIVGRLLKKLNENEEKWQPMSYFISGKKFRDVVTGVKELSEETNSPQLALIIGSYLKQIMLIKISTGIEEDDAIKRREGKDFQYMYQAHWNNRVSCVANRRQKLRQINKPLLTPITSDLLIFKTFLVESIDEEIQHATKGWKWLAELLMVRIILFNKRRVSEVEEIKVSDFQQIQQDVENEDILESLDVSEKALARRMSVLEVRGKSTRGIRRVFVLFTPDMVDAVKCLLGRRTHQSTYIFGRQCGTPLDGCQAFRHVTELCPKLKEPKRIRTTKLRKYLATTCQILDMQESELKLLADHMGHNINIHTDIYRLQSSVLERTKVARILMAMDNGLANHLRGKNLTNIIIDELPVPLAYDDEWTVPASSMNTQDMQGEAANSTDEEFEDVQTDEESEREMDVQMEKESAITLIPVKIKRPRWTKEENACFLKHLGHYIEARQNPPGDAIEKVVRLLGTRSTAQIRVKVSNLIAGKQKSLM